MMKRMFKTPHLREYFRLSVGYFFSGMMMHLQKKPFDIFLSRAIVYFMALSIFMALPVFSTPTTSYLEVTLILSDTLLTGSHSVTATLFDQRLTSENTKWTAILSNIEFRNGVGKIPIGPLDEGDLLMTSPNIALQIGSEEVIIELDSRFYAMQSKLSEKTMQFHDTEALYIDASVPGDKKVGIGTGVSSNLSHKLVVNGNLKFTQANTGILFDGMSTPITGSASFESLLSPIWTTSNSAVYYTQGNVGIGVSNPQHPLHVSGNIKLEGLPNGNSSTTIVMDGGLLKTRSLPASSFDGFENNPLGIFVAGTPIASLEVHPTSNLNHIFIARPTPTSSEGLYVRDSGKVGVATNNPTALFHLKSNTSDPIFIAKSSSTDLGIHIANNGNIGINTSNPLQSLDVSGNINIFGQYLLNSFVFFDSPNTTNVFVGYEAGENYNSGANNTFLGFQSGNSQTDASHNTFVGYQSGKDNQTGVNNTAMGAYSLTNVTSDDNVALGYHAASSLVGGEENTIIGAYAAASANTSIDSNVIIGYEAGKNMHGNSNTLIGYQAGKDLNGNNNILIGNKSGHDLVSIDNIFMISNETGTSRKVLLYGDLSDQKLAIATTNFSSTNKSLFVDGVVEVRGIKYPDGSIQTSYLGSETGYSWQRDGQNIYFPALSSTGTIGNGTVKIGTAGAAAGGNPRLLIKSGSSQTTLQLEGSLGSNNYGGKINFGDGNNVYIEETTDDSLTIHAKEELSLTAVTLNLVTSGNLFIPSLTTSTTVTDALVIDSNNFVSKRVLPWALDSNNNIYRQNHNVGIGTNNPSSAKLVVQNTSSGENILKLVGVVDGSSNKGVEMNTDGDIIMSGNLTIEGSLLDSSGNPKTFIIDHPLHSDKYLVHATLEGPEAGVYYRGKAQLQNGKAVITLPDYFESLTHEDNRTIQLNSENGWSPLFVKGEIKNGQFLVQTTNKGNPSQRFNWVVTAERKDVPKLEVEPLKSSIKVHSFGPYTYSEKLSP